MQLTEIKVSENELKCLKSLGEDSELCFFFRHIAQDTGFEIKQVRRFVRSLARKGLAKYQRGLFDDDGMVAGSGYGITSEGMDFLYPCDICGRYAMYQYNIDPKTGKRSWNDDDVEIKECSVHYKQSAEAVTKSLI